VEADGASSHEDGDQEGLNPSSEDDGAGFGPVVALLAILGGGMAARPRT
jgi:PGF-CTERM protein